MLEGLIPELFDEVVVLLDLPDLLPLRLASRRLERRSFAAFAASAFSELTTDFSSASVARLTRIARSRLAPAVRRLHVGDRGDHPHSSPTGRDAPYSKDEHWPRLEGGSVDPHCALAGAFSAAVACFGNCEAVTVTDELLRIRGHPSDVGPGRCLSSPDAAELVLRAYAATGAPPLRSLRLLILRNVDWWPPGSITPATVASARLALAGHFQELVLKYRDPESDQWLEQALDLVTASAHLATLRLFLGGPAREGRAAVGYRLGRRLDGFAPPLAHLALGGLTMREDDLLRLLARWGGTLQTLAFYRAGLGPGRWAGVLQHLSDNPPARLRRFSMQACLDGERAMTAFCPLWKARGELGKACGGEFDFRFARTNARGWRELHVAGVLFEPWRTGEMRPGLRAMMEHSHRASAESGVTAPCAADKEIRACRPVMDSWARWTGLGLDYRFP